MCFFSPIRNDPNKKTHKQIFGTHPVPGQSRKFVYVYVFFLFLVYVFFLFLNRRDGEAGIQRSGRPKPCDLSGALSNTSQPIPGVLFEHETPRIF